MTLATECSVLGNGNKLHHHLEWKAFLILLTFQDALPPVLQPLILAVSSVLLALHYKMAVRLPARCLKTKTKSDKYAFIPGTIKKGTLCFHRPTERETDLAARSFFWNILQPTLQFLFQNIQTKAALQTACLSKMPPTLGCLTQEGGTY